MSADAPASTLIPSRIGRVIGVLRKLIDYGKKLAETVQKRAAAPGCAVFARHFDTADIAVILARITAGLRRAAALEAMLSRRAAQGEELAPAPFAYLSASGEPRAPSQAASPHTRSEPRPAARAGDPRLARLPTEREIADEVRRRPVGAVIADICNDLGITPGCIDPAFWSEVGRIVMMYGGNLLRFLKDADKRLFPPASGHTASTPPAWPAASPALATGPP